MDGRYLILALKDECLKYRKSAAMDGRCLILALKDECLK
jgi:hypothetical protein